jgi:hypothetical protein
MYVVIKILLLSFIPITGSGAIIIMSVNYVYFFVALHSFRYCVLESRKTNNLLILVKTVSILKPKCALLYKRLLL